MINPRPRKKLLMFGWHMPSPTYLRDNLATMEQHPFDGVCIKLSESVGGGEVFDVRQWRSIAQPAREAEIAVLSSIPPSEVFTDNFIVLYGASTMDWFSDEDWEEVLDHTRYCARAAKAAGCKGVCWDAEPYHDINPWRFIELPTRDRHSFADHVAIVRRRGGQFMQVLQEVLPDITLFALRMLSDYALGSPFSQKVFNQYDLQTQHEQLKNSWWSLHSAFINGMLDAAGPDVTLVDGNEEAYFYTSAIEFYRIYATLRQDALMLVAPELHERYRRQYRIGHAVSVNYLAGRWADLLNGFPDYLTKQAQELTVAQRAEWFEHNTYYALSTADEYVWVYTEEANWWANENIPIGFAEAMASAKQKQATGVALGFVVEQMLLDAQAHIKARYIATEFTPRNGFTEGIEGPACDRDGNIYAVNFARQGTIGKVTPQGECSVFVELPHGSIGNGIRFNAQGDMLIADYTNHNILKVDMVTLEISVYAHEPTANQPNDICIADNDIVFASDPKWADGTGQIWRVGPDGKFVLLESGMGTTNGIEVSPDGRTLYVNETVQRCVWAYDLSPQGEIGNKRLLISFPDFAMDGMRCDVDGNLYITRWGKGTVAKVSPQGVQLLEVQLHGANCTNITFGGADGRTAYITIADNGNIECFRVETPGRHTGEARESPQINSRGLA